MSCVLINIKIFKRKLILYIKNCDILVLASLNNWCHITMKNVLKRKFLNEQEVSTIRANYYIFVYSRLHTLVQFWCMTLIYTFFLPTVHFDNEIWMDCSQFFNSFFEMLPWSFHEKLTEFKSWSHFFWYEKVKLSIEVQNSSFIFVAYVCMYISKYMYVYVLCTKL